MIHEMGKIDKLVLLVCLSLAFSSVLPQSVHSKIIAREANVVVTGTNDLIVVSTDAYEFSFSKSSLGWNASKRGSEESLLKCAGWKLYYNATSVQADGDEYSSTNGGHYWSNATFEGGILLNFTSISNLTAPTVMEYFWFYSQYFVIQVNATHTIPETAISVERIRYFDDVASEVSMGNQLNMNYVFWRYGERYQAQDIADSEPPMFIFSNKTDEGLVVAPIRPNWTHYARAYVSESNSKFLYELQTDTANADNITISEKNQVSFDRVFFQFTSADINQAFIEYASLYSSTCALRPYKGSQSYWLTWYAGNGGERGENLTENSVISNATWIADNLDSYYGFDGVLVDAIICDEVGDWLNYSRTRFPNGMPAIVDKIHAMGLKAGLWIAPLMVEKDGWINRTYPEAIAINKTGQPVLAQMHFGKIKRDLYFLNPFRSWVQDRLRWVNENISAWGFDFVKLDFLSGALSGLFQENKTRYMVMQQVLKSVTIGLDNEIAVTANVAASYNPSLLVNYVDRVWLYGPDLWVYSDTQQIQWESLTQKYDVLTNLIPFIRHFNLTVDSDALGRLSTQPSIPFSLTRFYSTYATVGGGTIEIGEKLSAIDNETLELYKKHLPFVPEKWSPVDWISIHRERPPRIWMYGDTTDEGQNCYAAVFNPEESNRTVKIDLQSHLKLPPGTYIIVDQYSSTLLGEHTTSIDISLDARETTVLTLTQKTPTPNFLMRSDHLTASAKFISSQFNEGQLTLHFLGEPETLTTLTIFSQHEPVHVRSGSYEIVRVSENAGFQTRNEACWYYDHATELLYVKVLPRSPATVVVSFIDDVAPVLWNPKRLLEEPSYDQNVKIMVNATDYHSSLGIVILSYSKSSAEFNLTMRANESHLFEAEIPANPYGTLIEYVVFVNDTWGNWVTSEVQSYIVADMTAPDVGVPYLIPEEPLENQEVTVSAQVSEPLSASGLEKARLWFRAGDEWSFAKMTIETGNATAVIPGKAGNVSVEFFLEVFDKAGNRVTTPTSSYAVKPVNTELSTVLTYLVMIGLVGVLLLGMCGFYCYRKKSKRAVGRIH